MDDFDYHYTYDKTDKTTNQLEYIYDDIVDAISEVDVDDQDSDCYAYDETGQLIKDKSNDIESIIWTVTGKVKKIIYDNDLNLDLETNVSWVEFEYDAMGVRVSKKVHSDFIIPSGHSGPDEIVIQDITTYYMHDASGNVLATYEHFIDYPEYPQEPIDPETFTLNEHHIYGNKRLGVTKEMIDMNLTYSPDTYHQRILGEKSYELSNHLGNVLNTVSDRLLANYTGDDIDYYDADVLSYTDYYPYGMVLRRGSDGGSYRYGFQGQEMDDEVKGEGNSVNYKYRMHDPRIGRFFAVDPLEAKYPHNSPYAFSENRLLDGVELEGLEFYYSADGVLLGQVGTDQTILVIKSGTISNESAKNYIKTINQKDPMFANAYEFRMTKNSERFSETSFDTQKNIMMSILEREGIYVKNIYSKHEIYFRDGAAATDDHGVFVTNTLFIHNDEYLYNSYWNVVFLFLHEEGHSIAARDNVANWRTPGPLTHFNIHFSVMSNEKIFDKTTDALKKYAFGVANGYLKSIELQLRDDLYIGIPNATEQERRDAYQENKWLIDKYYDAVGKLNSLQEKYKGIYPEYSKNVIYTPKNYEEQIEKNIQKYNR